MNSWDDFIVLVDTECTAWQRDLIAYRIRKMLNLWFDDQRAKRLSAVVTCDA